jgi:hypothetical protein
MLIIMLHNLASQRGLMCLLGPAFVKLYMRSASLQLLASMFCTYLQLCLFCF